MPVKISLEIEKTYILTNQCLFNCCNFSLLENISTTFFLDFVYNDTNVNFDGHYGVFLDI